MKKILLSFLFILYCSSLESYAQQIAVKNNVLYDATTTLNLGIEVALKPRLTLDVSGNLNPWTFTDNKKLKHWLLQPEVRLWNCEAFNRGFWGFHLLGGQYNVGGIKMPFGLWPSLKDERAQGWMIGAGVSYGYQWYLGPHWNLETTLGLGYIYTRYDAFECYTCGRPTGRRSNHYWGPTKIGVSFVYLFNSKK